MIFVIFQDTGVAVAFSFCFNPGFVVGLMYADEAQCEEEEIEWGICLCLGIINFFLEKERE